MSHELRTPLNAIIGFSDLLRQETFGPMGNAKYAEYNNDIHYSAGHLLELIDDILNCSQLDVGKVKVSASLIDVAGLITLVTKQVMFRPEAGSLIVETTVAKNIPLLSADSRLVKQILINLLVNALKFTREGGKISIGADIDHKGRINIRVSDTGVGIPEQDLIEITQPFFKSRHSQKVTAEGAGLGLAIAVEFINLHQGKIDIQSIVDAGTTVTCTFPAWRTFQRPESEAQEPVLVETKAKAAA